MIPSKRWFPSSLNERAAWYTNFNTQIQDVATSLGIVAADLTALAADTTLMNFLASEAVAIESYKDAQRQYRILITEGEIGSPTPSYPGPTMGMPTPVPTGVFERLDGLVRRIRAAPAYTDEIGALLGILPSQAGNGDSYGPPAELKPVIKASQSVQDYKFDVHVTRLGQEAFKVQIQRNGNGTWTDAAFATNNPCIVTITPTTPGQPERILVRAQLLSKNNPIGEPSDPTYVTVNP